MEKSRLSIVMAGHIDHGKSTLIGRLLYDTHSISEDKIEELKKASLYTGNKLEFAFLLDHLKEEREQGITIDTTQTFLKTEKREYQIIDAPGHVELVKNMITGAAQADSAILIIDASEGVMRQTRRHCFILSLLGINKVIVALNKMDKINYSRKRFEEIVTDTKKLFEQLKMQTAYFVPISALNGDNVCVLSKNMDWYQGKSLIELMEEIEEPRMCGGVPYILPVQDVYKIGENRIAAGRLEAGVLHKNDKIKVVQTGQISRISAIKKFMEEPESAGAGECIGIITEDALFLERGNIICHEEAKVEFVNEFEGRILWMDRRPMQIGEKLLIRCGTQETSCIIKEIRHKIHTDQLAEEQQDMERLECLDAGIIVIHTKKNLAVSKFTDYECIGRFVMIRQDNICAGGIIL